MKKEVIKNEISKKEQKDIANLLLGIRVASTALLFEGIFMLTYIISFFISVSGANLSLKFGNNNPNGFYLKCAPFLLLLFVIYIGIIFLNDYLVKNKYKNTKRILIAEITITVILMLVLFIIFKKV